MTEVQIVWWPTGFHSLDYGLKDMILDWHSDSIKDSA